MKMKTPLLMLAMAVVGTCGLQAQNAVKTSSFGDNWSIGLDGGVATPMHNSAFFGSMRGTAGIHIQKQLTPCFGLGAEGAWGVNTSSWKGMVPSSTAFDSQYVGAYGALNLMNLFGGYQCYTRPFEIEAVAGAGWGHYFINEANGDDWNYFATKVGLNFNFNVSEKVTVSVKPSVVWNMSDAPIDQTSAGYDINKATFNLAAGVSVKLGDGFQCVAPYNAAEVELLNDEINALRAAAATAAAAAEAEAARSVALANELAACQNRKPDVVKEVTTDLQSVRFVFFKLASYVITPDQMPNVEMIADYMKNHPDSKVEIKGYASQDGNLEFNIKLAQNRAEAVKNALINKYGISASRISAKGEGIGHMFKEESWNRVSICTLDE